MQSELRNINTGIGFSNCIAAATSNPTMQSTIFGQLIAYSRKNSKKYTNKIKINIIVIDNPLYTEHEYRALPIRFINKKA